MKKRITIFLTLVLVIIFTNNSYATFTTGKGKHTFKVDNFNADTRISLQSFLIGLGISENSSINFKLTMADGEDSDGSDPNMNFLVPSYDGYSDETEYNLSGPILDISYQYIPRHDLFVTPNSLNAVQIGLKTYEGEVFDQAGTNTVDLNKTYLTFGLLSRSRWEKRNLFSNIEIAYDPREKGGWVLDSQVGMEFKIIDNFRAHLSYRAIGSSIESKQGFAFGIKVDY
ncbi:hypothetical protein [Orenia marismortui]|uniref:Outer membrane protein with beta-barrel domain n=1 Tax=Orenia marismortui TaxID=46469 RepID=A0A4R8H1F3_9FIRM|nr:hypothetical protein [Orenia marismortui]TDX48207.1 hypothetical protein C7959_1322 [Orenia marismortui]